MNNIYLDYASTTPCDPAVVKAMEPYFHDKFGNPSSPHSFGQKAHGAVEEARKLIADAIGARPNEIVFTSGATESNNQAILTLALGLFNKGRHVIVGAMEHASVYEPAKRLSKLGFEVSFVDPDPYGVMDPKVFKNLIRPDTILILLQHANNEIGVIQPVEEIGQYAKEAKVCFLVDATQTVGHIPVNVNKISCDLLSFSAHKFYGPQGVGVLYVADGLKIEPRLYGGDQELSRRAGTLNVPGIVGMAKAIEIALSHMEREAKDQIVLRDRMIEYVLSHIKNVKLNGHRHQRLPNNTSFSFEGISGEHLVVALDLVGIAVSQGSSCTRGKLEASHVLKAIGHSDELAKGTIRATLGRWSKIEDVDYYLQQLEFHINKLRKI